MFTKNIRLFPKRVGIRTELGNENQNKWYLFIYVWNLSKLAFSLYAYVTFLQPCAGELFTRLVINIIIIGFISKAFFRRIPV